MPKVSFNKLNLKVSTETKNFKFNDAEIEVLQYLPVSDKYDLIMATLQKSNESGIYNDFKMNMYFHLHLVYLYTNITFTDKQREDEAKLYDALVSSGFMDEFLSYMNHEEYNDLWEKILSIADEKMALSQSAGYSIAGLLQSLPELSGDLADKVKDFDIDQEKLNKILEIAKSLGYKEQA